MIDTAQEQVEQSKKALLTFKLIREIDKPKALSFKSNVNISSIRAKANLLGYHVEQLTSKFVLLETKDAIVLISNRQIVLDSTKELFQDTEFTSIDFNNTDTSNIIDMSGMFEGCKAQSLDLSSFKIKITYMSYMYGMFDKCQASKIRFKDDKIKRALSESDWD